MRTLLIDNYDSYTYNLFQLIAETYGTAPTVRTNDDPDLARLPASGFDAVVLSPGPGRPQVPRDIGVTREILLQSEVPVLGVCLGHQTLAWLAGAEVAPAPRARHGYQERVWHRERGLFGGLPQGFAAVRYHSLIVARPLPATLEELAWAPDGTLMGLRHATRPWWGVQFHPESVASEHGARILGNFRRLIDGERGDQIGKAGPVAARTRHPRSGTGDSRGPRWTLRHRCLDYAVDAEEAFTALFGEQDYAFWLDSSRVEQGLSRFSFLGDAGGPHGEVLWDRTGTGLVEVYLPEKGTTSVIAGSIFDALRARTHERAVAPDPALPFDLTGGYVGYFGYELKANIGSPNRHTSTTAHAAWIAATRVAVVDHAEQRTWLVALCGNGNAGAADEWLAWARQVLEPVHYGREEGQARTHADRQGDGRGEPCEVDPEPWLVRSREDYLADIDECLRQLHAGESYEICLTNAVKIPFQGSGFDFYRRQRLHNPAPYGAYIRLDDVQILCSSPERFLKIGPDRVAESKPIKGSAPRHPDTRQDGLLRDRLVSSAKTRAENLMIVDLLRNDLGQCCRAGSVTVPRYMTVESYATVHQLVSTIRGRLRDDVSAVDAARACFPGGSMTGAPKLRTMEIIGRLEQRPRGIYSGAIGFFGLTGTADLSVVIRTAVAERGWLTAGAGGAIVLDSDPEEEYEEMLYKAQASIGALTPADIRTDRARRAVDLALTDQLSTPRR